MDQVVVNLDPPESGPPFDDLLKRLAELRSTMRRTRSRLVADPNSTLAVESLSDVDSVVLFNYLKFEEDAYETMRFVLETTLARDGWPATIASFYERALGRCRPALTKGFVDATKRDLCVWFATLASRLFGADVEVRRPAVRLFRAIQGVAHGADLQADPHWPAVKEDIKNKYVDVVQALLKKGNTESGWCGLWCILVLLMGGEVLANRDCLVLFNSLLNMLGDVFRHQQDYDTPTIIDGFSCWQVLIELFFEHRPCLRDKHYKLLMNLMKTRQKVDRPAVVGIKARTWWMFIRHLDPDTELFRSTTSDFLEFLRSSVIGEDPTFCCEAVALLLGVAPPARPRPDALSPPPAQGACLPGREHFLKLYPHLFAFYERLLTTVPYDLLKPGGDVATLLAASWTRLLYYVAEVIRVQTVNSHSTDVVKVLLMMIGRVGYYDSEGLDERARRQALLLIVPPVLHGDYSLPDDVLTSTKYYSGEGLMVGTPALYLTKLLLTRHGWKTKLREADFLETVRALVRLSVASPLTRVEYIEKALDILGERARECEGANASSLQVILDVWQAIASNLKESLKTDASALARDVDWLYEVVLFPVVHYKEGPAIESLRDLLEQIHASTSGNASLACNEICERLSERLTTLLEDRPDRLVAIACAMKQIACSSADVADKSGDGLVRTVELIGRVSARLDAARLDARSNAAVATYLCNAVWAVARGWPDTDSLFVRLVPVVKTLYDFRAGRDSAYDKLFLTLCRQLWNTYLVKRHNLPSSTPEVRQAVGDLVVMVKELMAKGDEYSPPAVLKTEPENAPVAMYYLMPVLGGGEEPAYVASPGRRILAARNNALPRLGRTASPKYAPPPYAPRDEDVVVIDEKEEDDVVCLSGPTPTRPKAEDVDAPAVVYVAPPATAASHPQRRPLTKHQREVMRRRRDDIPAMYGDLTQDTQSQNTQFGESSSTQETAEMPERFRAAPKESQDSNAAQEPLVVPSAVKEVDLARPFGGIFGSSSPDRGSVRADMFDPTKREKISPIQLKVVHPKTAAVTNEVAAKMKSIPGTLKNWLQTNNTSVQSCEKIIETSVCSGVATPIKPPNKTAAPANVVTSPVLPGDAAGKTPVLSILASPPGKTATVVCGITTGKSPVHANVLTPRRTPLIVAGAIPDNSTLVPVVITRGKTSTVLTSSVANRTPVLANATAPTKTPVLSTGTISNKTQAVANASAPCKIPVLENAAAPSKTPVLANGLAPNKTPVLANAAAPSKTPIPANGMAPSKTPVLANGMAPSKTPVLANGMAPSKTPVPANGMAPSKTPIPSTGTISNKTLAVANAAAPIKTQVLGNAAAPSKTPVLANAMVPSKTLVLSTGTPSKNNPVLSTGTISNKTPVVANATAVPNKTPVLSTGTLSNKTPVLSTGTISNKTPVVANATAAPNKTPVLSTGTLSNKTPVLSTGTISNKTPVVANATAAPIKTPVLSSGTLSNKTPVISTGTPSNSTPVLANATSPSKTLVLANATTHTKTPVLGNATTAPGITPILSTSTSSNKSQVLSTDTPSNKTLAVTKATAAPSKPSPLVNVLTPRKMPLLANSGSPNVPTPRQMPTLTSSVSSESGARNTPTILKRALTETAKPGSGDVPRGKKGIMAPLLSAAREKTKEPNDEVVATSTLNETEIGTTGARETTKDGVFGGNSSFLVPRSAIVVGRDRSPAKPAVAAAENLSESQDFVDSSQESIRSVVITLEKLPDIPPGGNAIIAREGLLSRGPEAGSPIRIHRHSPSPANRSAVARRLDTEAANEPARRSSARANLKRHFLDVPSITAAAEDVTEVPNKAKAVLLSIAEEQLKATQKVADVGPKRKRKDPTAINVTPDASPSVVEPPKLSAKKRKADALDDSVTPVKVAILGGAETKGSDAKRVQLLTPTCDTNNVVDANVQASCLREEEEDKSGTPDNIETTSEKGVESVSTMADGDCAFVDSSQDVGRDPDPRVDLNGGRDSTAANDNRPGHTARQLRELKNLKIDFAPSALQAPNKKRRSRTDGEEPIEISDTESVDSLDSQKKVLTRRSKTASEGIPTVNKPKRTSNADLSSEKSAQKLAEHANDIAEKPKVRGRPAKVVSNAAANTPEEKSAQNLAEHANNMAEKPKARGRPAKVTSNPGAEPIKKLQPRKANGNNANTTLPEGIEINNAVFRELKSTKRFSLQPPSCSKSVGDSTVESCKPVEPSSWVKSMTKDDEARQAGKVPETPSKSQVVEKLSETPPNTSADLLPGNVEVDSLPETPRKSGVVEVRSETSRKSVAIEVRLETPRKSGVVEVRSETSRKIGVVEVRSETPSKSGAVEARSETSRKSGAVEVRSETSRKSVAIEVRSETPRRSGTVEVRSETSRKSVAIEVRSETPRRSGTGEVRSETPRRSGAVEVRSETPRKEPKPDVKVVDRPKTMQESGMEVGDGERRETPQIAIVNSSPGSNVRPPRDESPSGSPQKKKSKQDDKKSPVKCPESGVDSSAENTPDAPPKGRTPEVVATSPVGPQKPPLEEASSGSPAVNKSAEPGIVVTPPTPVRSAGLPRRAMGRGYHNRRQSSRSTVERIGRSRLGTEPETAPLAKIQIDYDAGVETITGDDGKDTSLPWSRGVWSPCLTPSRPILKLAGWSSLDPRRGQRRVNFPDEHCTTKQLNYDKGGFGGATLGSPLEVVAKLDGAIERTAVPAGETVVVTQELTVVTTVDRKELPAVLTTPERKELPTVVETPERKELPVVVLKTLEREELPVPAVHEIMDLSVATTPDGKESPVVARSPESKESPAAVDSQETQEFVSPAPLALPRPELLNDTGAFFPPLMYCDRPVNDVTKFMVTPTWRNNLNLHLRDDLIETVGDFCRLTERRISRLPLREPKVETARKTLKTFHRRLVEADEAERQRGKVPPTELEVAMSERSPHEVARALQNIPNSNDYLNYIFEQMSKSQKVQDLDHTYLIKHILKLCDATEIFDAIALEYKKRGGPRFVDAVTQYVSSSNDDIREMVACGIKEIRSEEFVGILVDTGRLDALNAEDGSRVLSYVLRKRDCKDVLEELKSLGKLDSEATNYVVKNVDAETILAQLGDLGRLCGVDTSKLCARLPRKEVLAYVAGEHETGEICEALPFREVLKYVGGRASGSQLTDLVRESGDVGVIAKFAVENETPATLLSLMKGVGGGLEACVDFVVANERPDELLRRVKRSGGFEACAKFVAENQKPESGLLRMKNAGSLDACTKFVVENEKPEAILERMKSEHLLGTCTEFVCDNEETRTVMDRLKTSGKLEESTKFVVGNVDSESVLSLVSENLSDNAAGNADAINKVLTSYCDKFGVEKYFEICQQHFKNTVLGCLNSRTGTQGPPPNGK